MQRNMDLVRIILMRIEASPSGWASRDFGIEGYPPGTVPYHAHIMKQEGLIEGVDVTNFEGSGLEVIPTSLTWNGHEFLDLARDSDRWRCAKNIIGKVGGASISVWLKVLTDLTLKDVDNAASSSRVITP